MPYHLKDSHRSGQQKMSTSITALQLAIQSRMLSLRDQRVMLDAKLAALYGVETKVLVQAINIEIMRA